MARSRRTSAMLVNRCSSKLSGNQNHERNQKVTTSRDDKGKGDGSIREWLLDRGVFHHLGWARRPMSALSKNIFRKGGRPLKPKEGMNGPPKALVTGGRNCRSLGFPGFPVESCGFGQLHVVFFGENHMSGAAESCDVGNPGTLGMTKERAMVS
jgi:hypothetical protein